MPKTAQRRALNWVDVAINLIGGPTKASHLLDISHASIHRMRCAGRMPTDTLAARDRVARLSDLSGIEVIKLLGFSSATPPASGKVRKHPRSGSHVAA